MTEARLTRPAVPEVAVIVAVLLAIASLATCSTRGKKLDPAAVSTMCQASEDAIRADRSAESEFEDAAAASKQGGWDQNLAVVGERLSRRVERARWRRLSAGLLDASRKRTDTAIVVLRTTRDISEMHSKAVRLGDEGSISALDRCGADADRYAK